MTTDLPETLPVFCRHRGDIEHPHLTTTNAPSQSPDEWLRELETKRLPQITEAFREGAARDWVSQLVVRWKLDDLPLTDVSLSLGISEGQGSRFRNHYSASVGVLGQWAASQRVSFLTPNHGRWSVMGLREALKITAWLHETADTRPNRTALRPLRLQENDLYLLVTMLSARLVENWDQLTDRYEPDLYPAASNEEFTLFVKLFESQYLHVTQIDPAARSRYPLYFSNRHVTDTSRWILCHDIDQMWRKLHLELKHIEVPERTWEAIDVLTPWLCASPPAEDDETK